ncbi:hypothetical protein [Streptomyces zhihengii]|uniref:Nuclear transport factor 2 family protein n=1 Tax=Streptomyces zhihengii TaxID=1818004 RepID=A0ABS2V535_9ACTN|nr:hypothetical protein [Streptomyces zhihengii]MBM9624733.1 hypothetical protein [Streptomyces zhihengii]
MTDMLDTFWAAINQQLEQLRTATNADDVLRTLATDQGPDRGFFAGSGGDETVSAALHHAGWELTWAESSIDYTMRAPDGSMITYIEGDILRGDHHTKTSTQTSHTDN